MFRVESQIQFLMRSVYLRKIPWSENRRISSKLYIILIKYFWHFLILIATDSGEGVYLLYSVHHDIDTRIPKHS